MAWTSANLTWTAESGNTVITFAALDSSGNVVSTTTATCYLVVGGGGRGGGAETFNQFQQAPYSPNFADEEPYYSDNKIWNLTTGIGGYSQEIDRCGEITAFIAQLVSTGQASTESGPASSPASRSSIKFAGSAVVSAADVAGKSANVPVLANEPVAPGVTSIADIIDIFSNGAMGYGGSTLTPG
ncbi:hypothetical protein [Gluconacetobacter tumulicola]|uniref:Uncharacterized protein n=1 Tax=Gluconacetobacter tumulicola TaxID=1017177 RepID=A0A7W4P964_9PROT|nr:hypothetical protein [Gluconacetobacter tumulicola]MBB2180133.1 hypothetical protein [Gluconacetobacter tumulicola]